MKDSQHYFVSTNVQFTHFQSLLKNLDVQCFFAINKEFSKFEAITKVVVTSHMIQEGQIPLLIIVQKLIIEDFKKKMEQLKLKISVLSNFHYYIKYLFFVLKFENQLLNQLTHILKLRIVLKMFLIWSIKIKDLQLLDGIKEAMYRIELFCIKKITTKIQNQISTIN